MQICSIINEKVARDTPQLAILSGRKAHLHHREIGYGPVAGKRDADRVILPVYKDNHLHGLGMLG